MTILLKYFYLLLSLLLGLIMQSCIATDDFAIPEPEATVVTPSGLKITIAALKGQFDYQTKEPITFSKTQTYIEGYIVSSDEAGNFFKELVIQDAPKNPTSGIQILIDERSLYQKYDFGRKIFIALDGLSLGLDNGVLKLGKVVEKNIEAIAEFEAENLLMRSSEIMAIVPKKITVEDFDTSLESMYVKLEDVQFAKEVLTTTTGTLAGAAIDRFQGERELQSCATQESFILSTSVFADFKSLRLPDTQGSVAGILSKDFFGDYYVLRMNTPDDLIFKGTSRCDVDYVRCDSPARTISRNTILLEEDFESIKKTIQLDALGWTNYNSNGDDKRWESKKIINVANRVMTISAFNSRLNPLEVWLITPEINLDKTTNEVLSLEIRTSFNNGQTLTILMSNDFKGDPKTTKWLPLDIAVPTKNANKVRIDLFSLSCLKGKVHLAFRYNGRDPGATSTYSLDNIKISGVSME